MTDGSRAGIGMSIIFAWYWLLAGLGLVCPSSLLGIKDLLQQTAGEIRLCCGEWNLYIINGLVIDSVLRSRLWPMRQCGAFRRSFRFPCCFLWCVCFLCCCSCSKTYNEIFWLQIYLITFNLPPLCPHHYLHTNN